MTNEWGTMVGCYDIMMRSGGLSNVLFFFFFNDTATTEIYTLSLHDALPISSENRYCFTKNFWSLILSEIVSQTHIGVVIDMVKRSEEHTSELQSPVPTSYAVFCLKKKKKFLFYLITS